MPCRRTVDEHGKSGFQALPPAGMEVAAGEGWTQARGAVGVPQTKVYFLMKGKADEPDEDGDHGSTPAGGAENGTAAGVSVGDAAEASNSAQDLCKEEQCGDEVQMAGPTHSEPNACVNAEKTLGVLS